LTVRDLTQIAAGHPMVILIVFVAVPVIAGVVGLLHGRGRGGLSPWKYVYTVIIYLVCIPGILSAVLTGYALFFTRQNLLDVNLLVYFVPVISMAVTLILASKSVKFDAVPGFGRLSGLMAIIAITFVLALAIQKTRLWLFFGASIFWFVVLVVGLFVLLKWGVYMLFRSR
jgi:hypothetical protein